MNLAVNPPVLPMLARRVGELPPGEGWIFEPKWDGFRALIFRDGDEIFIQSRDGKPLNRYFPELLVALKEQLPERCVLDGEIVIAHDDGLDFEALQHRLHPAESRVKKQDGTYEPNKRVMLKVKHERECDCVVAGFRWHKRGEKTAVGSLLLGLFDGDSLQHVGVCASFTNLKRQELVSFLAPYRDNALDDHPWRNWAEAQPDEGAEPQRRPGAQSRWSAGKDLSWEALRPELVVQVAYDHMHGNRFRHTAQFRRWRDDKPPHECTFEQLEVVAPHELAAIFNAGR